MEARNYNPSSGRKRQAHVWSSLASQHNLVDKPQATARNPTSKIARKIVHEEQHPRLNAFLHTCLQAHTETEGDAYVLYACTLKEENN